jgi:hypothetical protein
MKYRKLFPLRVRCGGWPNYVTYAFTIHANIPLTWVEPEHVPCMLNVKWGCCGKKKAGGVMFASADDVRRWTNRGGR